MAVRSDTAKLNFNEIHHVLLGDDLGILVESGVNVRQLFHQNQHFLIGQRLKPNHRGEQIPVFAGEMALRQTGAQRFVAVDAPARIFHALGRTAKNKTDVTGLSLHGVVIHGQNFLIVVLSGDGIGNFINVDQFIDQHQHSGITGLFQKTGEQFQILIPVVIRDDNVDAQLLFGFGFGSVFSPEPLQHFSFRFIVPGNVGLVV